MTLDVSGTVTDIRIAAHVGDMRADDAAEDESEETGVLNIALDLIEPEVTAE
jgi:hypothetical protein